jgi:hypothetical protein
LIEGCELVIGEDVEPVDVWRIQLQATAALEADDEPSSIQEGVNRTRIVILATRNS